jgi:hypothetical protein
MVKTETEKTDKPAGTGGELEDDLPNVSNGPDSV